jgi:hypothetical protein
MALTNPETPLASNLHQPQPTPRFAPPLRHLLCAQTPNWNASDELSRSGRREWAAYETLNPCNKDFTSYPLRKKI